MDSGEAQAKAIETLRVSPQGRACDRISTRTPLGTHRSAAERSGICSRALRNGGFYPAIVVRLCLCMFTKMLAQGERRSDVDVGLDTRAVPLITGVS